MNQPHGSQWKSSFKPEEIEEVRTEQAGRYAHCHTVREATHRLPESGFQPISMAVLLTGKTDEEMANPETESFLVH